MSTELFTTTVDSPEITNKPILHNFDTTNFDGRGLPKVGVLRDVYEGLYDILFLSKDKCYFIEKESYKIGSEDEISVTFVHTRTGDEKVIKRKDMEKLRGTRHDDMTPSSFYIPHFGWDIMNSLFHKLEIGTLTLDDNEVKEKILERYDLNFNTMEYPYQWSINSLFNLSILLDFDDSKKKKLGEHFILNALNCTYSEEDGHYGLMNQYCAKNVRDKLGLQIIMVDYDDRRHCLGVEDCKKIANSVGLNGDEFSYILQRSLDFKNGNLDSIPRLANHRSQKILLEDIEEYISNN